MHVTPGVVGAIIEAEAVQHRLGFELVFVCDWGNNSNRTEIKWWNSREQKKSHSLKRLFFLSCFKFERKGKVKRKTAWRDGPLRQKHNWNFTHRSLILCLGELGDLTLIFCEALAAAACIPLNFFFFYEKIFTNFHMVTSDCAVRTPRVPGVLLCCREHMRLNPISLWGSNKAPKVI